MIAALRQGKLPLVMKLKEKGGGGGWGGGGGRKGILSMAYLPCATCRWPLWKDGPGNAHGQQGGETEEGLQ